MTENNSHQAIADIYNHFAQQDYRALLKNEANYTFPSQVTAILNRHSLHKPSYTVLDLGCGPGNLKDYTNFASYTGVDIAEEMLEGAAGSGYQALFQLPMEEFLASAGDNSYDAVFALSNLYFFSPLELPTILKEIKRVAKHFWLITLDGVTLALQEIYKENSGIGIYNHIGFEMGGVKERFTDRGWDSPTTEEEIEVEFILGLK